LPPDKAWNWANGRLVPDYYLGILDKLQGSHFNCVMDYGSTLGGLEPAREFLDALEARGLKSIFSVKDLMVGAFHDPYTKKLPWRDLMQATHGVVRAFRDHPAVIGWYVNDEVCTPRLWQGAVDVFRETRGTDPWHPTWAVHYDWPRVAGFHQACDAIGTDPYVLTGDIHQAGASWHAVRQALPPGQPIWAVVQCFGPGYENSNPSDTREPTYDEERAATFSAIAEGATGIIYYCFHSLQRSPRFEARFDELDRIAGEVQGLVPILGLPDATEGVVVEQGTVSLLTKQGGGRLWVILSSTERTEQTLTLRLPFRPKRVRDMTTGTDLTAEGLRLKLPLRALDARVVEVERA
jgi:hypothetical protein